MILPARQIQVVSVPEGGEREPFVGPIASDKAQTISPELDLRGLTVDDAQYALGKYLDDARLAGLERVRLIHGKGTGVLRQAVPVSYTHLDVYKRQTLGLLLFWPNAEAR